MTFIFSADGHIVEPDDLLTRIRAFSAGLAGIGSCGWLIRLGSLN